MNDKIVRDKFQIILADDDEDDRMFFSDALAELSLSTTLKTVFNGIELMDLLESDFQNLPDAIFMDLNMPLKSGEECLMELKKNKILKSVPVIIYSTSFNPEMIEVLYNNGAQYYIRKPGDFSNIKSVVKKAIFQIKKYHNLQPEKKEFVIEP